MKLFENPLQSWVVTSVKVQFAQLGVSLEPQALILGFLQCLQGGFIEVLQQFHLKIPPLRSLVLRGTTHSVLLKTPISYT